MEEISILGHGGYRTLRVPASAPGRKALLFSGFLWKPPGRQYTKRLHSGRSLFIGKLYKEIFGLSLDVEMWVVAYLNL